MKFSVMLDTHVDKVPLVEEAEVLGYDKAMFGDSQLIWSDCYVTMALAAARTRHIKIGVGVTAPGVRSAPATACAIGTINRVSHGRAFLGIGTGHTAMRLVGQLPATLSTLREYITVVRKLLDGEVASYELNGRQAQIQFLHRDRHYVNLDDRIPIYVAAQGPKTIQVAGELTDGWITAGGATVADIRKGVETAKSAAAAGGRPLPDDFVVCNMMSPCVLRPGESVTSDRVISQVGVAITTQLHFFYEVWAQTGRRDQAIPWQFAPMWSDYVATVEKHQQGGRALKVHDGHSTFLLEEERRFLTPQTIKAGALVGEADEIVETLRNYEAAGLTEACLLPPADVQEDVIREFAREILPRFQ